MKTVLVIPTYNERANIQPLVERIRALPVQMDIFFVDDGSPDGTGNLLDSLQANDPKLRVMHRPDKLGLGTAYRQAFHLLLKEGYQRFVSMDADLSHQPETIPNMLSASEDVDLVIGSRYVEGGRTRSSSTFRNALSRVANAMARGLLDLSVKDVTAGFRCYRRELLAALDCVNIRSNGYSFLVEMTYYSQVLGFRIGEVPILFEDRIHAKSKMSRSEITQAMRTLVRLAWHRASGQSVADRNLLAVKGQGRKGSSSTR
jgi:glycosyltransferase involved in cell wall biosynthesis